MIEKLANHIEKIQKESINKYFTDRPTIKAVDKKHLFTEENNESYILIEINDAVENIIKDKDELFSLKETKKNEIAEIVHKTPLSQNFEILLNRCLDNYDILKQKYPIHIFSPFVDLFIKQIEDDRFNKKLRSFTDLKSGSIEHLKIKVNTLNEFVDSIRQEVQSENFKKSLNLHQRPFDKNYKSLVDYVDKLFEQHSKLLVIKMDFGYFNSYDSLENGSNPKELLEQNRIKSEQELYEKCSQAQKDMKHFFRNAKSNSIFKHMLGYTWKLDYGGSYKGFYYHIIFFFDGSKVDDDVTIARMMGEYWVNTITNKEGIYWIYNKNKDENSIGMINRNNKKSLEILKNIVCHYLIKVDIYAKINSKKIGRTFGKGEIMILPKN